jgi:type IV pilus assembly protein PilM
MKTKSFNVQVTHPWKRVLGLDISNRSFKYVLLSRKNGSFLIEGFGKYALESGQQKMLTKLGQIIQQLLGNNRSYRQAKIVIGVEGSKLVVKNESFPSLGKKELGQTVSFGMQQEMGTDGDVGGLVFDLVSKGPDPEKEGQTRYLTMGFSEELANEKVGLFAAKNVIPNKITPNVVSLVNLIKLLPPETANKVIGLLDIGAKRSMLVIVKRRELDFFREIMVGGDEFTKAITGIIFHEGKAIQFTHPEAVEFKTRFGYPLGFSEGMTFHGAPLGEVGTMMRPVVERLSGEIDRSLAFYKDSPGAETPENLYLIGGGARMKHLPEVLREKIQIPVSTFPFPKKLRVSGDKEQKEAFAGRFLEQALSLSLAMESGSQGNLLPKAYQGIHKTRRVQKVVNLGVLGVAALLALFTLFTRHQVVETQNHLQIMESKAATLKNTGQLFAALKSHKDQVESRMGQLDQRLVQDKTFVSTLRLVSNTFPKRVRLVYYEYGLDLHLRTKKPQNQEEEAVKSWMILMRGFVKDPPNDIGIDMARFVVDLEKSGYFSKVVMENPQIPSEEEEYWFEIVGYLR